MTMEILDYARRLREERKHFRRVLGDDSNQGLIAVPQVWHEVEGVMANKIAAATGSRDGVSLIVDELDSRSDPRLLSLGAGSCALELDWILPAMRNPGACRLECADLDRELMDAAESKAESRGFQFEGTVQDANRLRLEPGAYDVVLCWASLHHFTDLEHIAEEINRALKPNGVFVTMDLCSRNGFLLWPETEEVVDLFWALLPERYRVAHTLGPKPQVCDHYPNVDCARSGFECIRSESILPALETHLARRHLIFAHALLRRFFDTMFGPNFDLARRFDRGFYNLVREHDEMALATRRLRPETFFGVYEKRSRPAEESPSLDSIFFGGTATGRVR